MEYSVLFSNSYGWIELPSFWKMSNPTTMRSAEYLESNSNSHG